MLVIRIVTAYNQLNVTIYNHLSVKLVYNDHHHPLNPKFVAVIDIVALCYEDLNWDSKMVVVVGSWSLAKV